MSLELVLAGLYPPRNTELEWNKNLNWQPIPYTFEEINSDSLLLVIKTCLRFQEELDRVLKEEIKDDLEKYAELFEKLKIHTGWENITPFLVQSLYDTLKSQASSKTDNQEF